MTPTSIVAYLVLFAAVGFLFLYVALFLGRLLRPNLPTPQKVEPYECGEPPIGSSQVQFDLRFYVVALVFIIFEVEVALFFPPAVVFGKATQLMSRRVDDPPTPLYHDLGIGSNPEQFGTQQMFPTPDEIAPDARRLAVAAMLDLAAFFVVILVGFAYVWWRGDLNWVRAFARPGDRGMETGPQLQGSGRQE